MPSTFLNVIPDHQLNDRAPFLRWTVDGKTWDHSYEVPANDDEARRTFHRKVAELRVDNPRRKHMRVILFRIDRKVLGPSVDIKHRTIVDWDQARHGLFYFDAEYYRNRLLLSYASKGPRPNPQESCFPLN